jgi:hypothetical protein
MSLAGNAMPIEITISSSEVNILQMPGDMNPFLEKVCPLINLRCQEEDKL